MPTKQFSHGYDILSTWKYLGLTKIFNDDLISLSSRPNINQVTDMPTTPADPRWTGAEAGIAG